LGKLCREGNTPQGRLHALYTLDGLNALETALVEQALSDVHYGVRLHALQLAERWLDKQPALLTKAVALGEDPHLKVRLRLAFSLGESQDAKGLEALARLANRDANDPWMRTAILSAVPTRAGRLAGMILASRNEKKNADALLQPLAAVVGARRQAEEV